MNEDIDQIFDALREIKTRITNVENLVMAQIRTSYLDGYETALNNSLKKIEDIGEDKIGG